MSESNQATSDIRLTIIKETVGIFSLVGVGLGLTGGITLSQLSEGGGILGGVLVLVVLTFAFLIGPLVAVITGMRAGERYGQSSQTYFAGGAGAVGGYLSMMVIVLLIVSLAMSTLSGDAGGGASATQSASTSGSGLNIGEYLVPVVAVAIPTAVTGLGGVFLAGEGQVEEKEVTSSSTAGENEGEIQSGSAIDSLPIKKIGAVVAVIAVVGVGIAFIGGTTSSLEETLDVTFEEQSISEGDVTHTWTVKNPTNSDIQTTMKSDITIDGEEITEGSKEIMVPANEQVTVSIVAAEDGELTSQQETMVQEFDYRALYNFED